MEKKYSYKKVSRLHFTYVYIKSCICLFYIEHKKIKLLIEFDVRDKMLFTMQRMYQYTGISVLWSF